MVSEGSEPSKKRKSNLSDKEGSKPGKKFPSKKRKSDFGDKEGPRPGNEFPKNWKEIKAKRYSNTEDDCKFVVDSSKPFKRQFNNKPTHEKKLKDAKLDHRKWKILMCILSFVDDTSLVSKLIFHELEKYLKELALDKYGQRPLLHLLCPNVPRYFPADVLETLRSTISSLTTCTQDGPPQSADDEPSESQKASSETDIPGLKRDEKDEENPEESEGLGKISKKDFSMRRIELLTKTGFAQKLTEMCMQNVGELLRSWYGTDIFCEVANGGAGDIMWQVAAESLNALHRAIADVGALPQLNNEEGSQNEEHIFVQYHSSRTVRKLILESHVSDGVNAPSFAAILWDVALKGKCKMWAQGHSEKVVSAFLDCSDLEVKNMASSELQPLIDAGFLKIASAKHV